MGGAAIATLSLALASEASAGACSAAAVSLVFGAYDPFRLGHTDSTGNIAVSCTGKPGESMAYSIAFDAGGSGTFVQRRMRSAHSTTLNYNIYVSASRSVVWGDGNSGTSLITDSFILPAGHVTRNYPVYGRIFGRQNARVGIYTDSITVTLTF